MNDRYFLIAGAAITICYFVIMANPFFHLIPGAGYDDVLQFRLSQSIASGHWLGEYNSITLAKGITYPLWQAFLHSAGVPLWLGNILLYTFATLVLMIAVYGVLKNKWALLFIYTLILYNPMSSVRAYRDVIAPALIILVLAWIIGLFSIVSNEVRSKRKLQIGWGKLFFTAIGAIGLTAWWYLREDAFFVLPFVAGGIAVTLGLVIYGAVARTMKPIGALYTGLLLIVPIVAVYGGGVAIASTNNQVYGRYIVNDYTSEEFGTAYGALMRVQDHDKPPTVPVSYEMRQSLYKASPSFRELKFCLDNSKNGECEFFKESGSDLIDDYEGGWFSWALRLAVSRAGYYDNPSEAKDYYTKLGNEVNRACDDKILSCSTDHHASLAPPFEGDTTVPIINASVYALSFLYELRSPPFMQAIVGNDLYTPEKEKIANFLGVRYHRDQASTGDGVKSSVKQTFAIIYQLLNPVLFITSVLMLLMGTIFCSKLYRKYWKVLLLGWALLLLTLLRLVMLAYVDVTSFPAIGPGYLASLYPVMFLFEGLVLSSSVAYLYQLFRDRTRRAGSKSDVYRVK